MTNSISGAANAGLSFTRLIRPLAVLAAATLVGGAAQASASTVVTFSGLNLYYSLSDAKPVYSEGGLTFTDPTYGMVNGFKDGFAGAVAYPSTITITPEAGGTISAFDFISEQFTQPNDADPAYTITFTGTKADGEVVTATLDIAGYSDVIYTFAPTGFTDLVSMTESVSGGGLIFDNFTFSASSVPEPSSVALLLAGLGVAGAAARRRKSA